MPVQVTVGNPHGLCNGVQRAIKIVCDTAKINPGKTYLLGDVVHNKHVVNQLEQDYRVKTVQKLQDIPKGATVIIRAHGAAPAILTEAKKRDLKVVDATCPLVAQVHAQVKRLVGSGKNIIYIASEKNHDEAVGVWGEAPGKVKLVTLSELENIKITDPANTVVLTQTTLSILETGKALTKLQKKYPDLTVKPHICMATTLRQKAVIKLAPKSDVFIIVGSPSSSNSNRLAEVSRASKVKTYIIDTHKELKKEWFGKAQKVAISSGASTPESLLNEVVNKIKSFKG